MILLLMFERLASVAWWSGSGIVPNKDTHTGDEKKIALLPVYILQFLAQIEMGNSVYNGNVLY